VTPLAEKLAATIRAGGPVTIADYMAACLGDPEYGYYANRPALGAEGDFITAPEVSQMFGELIGVWCIAAWEAMGAPDRFTLVELGPGRGTLMTDLLRAVHIRPNFRLAAEIHLVETSTMLRDAQARALRAVRATPEWHDCLADVPDDAPLILVANEFFDALPVHQYVRTAEGWAERMAGLGPTDELAFGLIPMGTPRGLPQVNRNAPVNAVWESSPAREALAAEIAERIAAHGGAALIVDYGYKGPALGDTLQAVKEHAFDPPLAHPGEADVTAHVDFGALAAAAEAAGAKAKHLLTQGGFLRALGLAARAERLAAGKDETQRAEITRAVDRLSGSEAMGTLFKVLCLAAPGLSLAPFDSA
jgi:SAM-dependent MidA family methyltransferase